jgi:hypothetical protein
MITRIEEAFEHVNQRNELRRVSALPLLHVEQEVRDLIRQDRHNTGDLLWRQFSDQVGDRVFSKILARERIRRGDPNWVPRGSFFNGNPNFYYEVARRKRALFERMCSQQLSVVEQNYSRLTGELSHAAALENPRNT